MATTSFKFWTVTIGDKPYRATGASRAKVAAAYNIPVKDVRRGARSTLEDAPGAFPVGELLRAWKAALDTKPQS